MLFIQAGVKPNSEKKANRLNIKQKLSSFYDNPITQTSVNKGAFESLKLCQKNGKVSKLLQKWTKTWN